MAFKHFLIVANWKTEPQSCSEAQRLFRKTKYAAMRRRRVTTVVCPPSVYLSRFSCNRAHRFWLGAQDVSWESGGAHTGEVSPAMLFNCGVSFVIVGHSERRARGESDETVARKIKAALGAGLRPILCVGESARDPEGHYIRHLREEIKGSLTGVSRKDIGRIVIAYEPIWAIGASAKYADTPEATQEIVILIKRVLADLFGKGSVMKVPVLYGGSVDDLNAGDFLEKGGVSGLLVGRASLHAKIFGAILKKADAA